MGLSALLRGCRWLAWLGEFIGDLIEVIGVFWVIWMTMELNGIELGIVIFSVTIFEGIL